MPKRQFTGDPQSQRFQGFKRSQTIGLGVGELRTTRLFPQPRHNVLKLQRTRPHTLNDFLKNFAIGLDIHEDLGREKSGFMPRVSIAEPLQKFNGKVRSRQVVMQVGYEWIVHALKM